MKKIKQNIDRNYLDRKTAKMLTLSSGNNKKYKYLAKADTFTREKSIRKSCNN